ncbi:hypothetical protein LX64_01341 [Chitinophaga skermanii]|uniref:Uncharacterized protein n=1 Tax=Chitinophaga skermanii TaxID=331697 RepID=A0A327R482_9BACT|nr:hypothetical protein [Chitinophaga skermanii]RAJ08687.1 hypothetical protein LX64_01341 [Chitinophaga skermanii]
MLGKQLSRTELRNIAGGKAKAEPCAYILFDCSECPWWCKCDTATLDCWA